MIAYFYSKSFILINSHWTKTIWSAAHCTRSS